MQWASMQSDLKQAFVELALGVFHEVEVQVLPARDISSLLKVAGTPGQTIGSLMQRPPKLHPCTENPITSGYIYIYMYIYIYSGITFFRFSISLLIFHCFMAVFGPDPCNGLPCKVTYNRLLWNLPLVSSMKLKSRCSLRGTFHHYLK